jgi:lysophospholipase L1-like esterase
MHDRRLLITAVMVAVAGCGGGKGPSTGPSGGTPSGATYDVVGQVFFDENANGTFDSGESTRLPAAQADVAGRRGTSDATTGRVLVSGVPGGSWTGRIVSLPPFFRATTPTVTVPQASGMDVPFAVSLPIGSNRPDVYLGFGDSITVGNGSSDDRGYRDLLADKLRDVFGRGDVIDEGFEATRTPSGVKRLAETIRRRRAGYTLILYGTNDWNGVECKKDEACETVANLLQMVRIAKQEQSLPVLGTIIPANPNLNRPERNEWVHEVNDQLRALAPAEGAVVADLEAAFLKYGDLPRLFADHVHPNDRGYALMADEWFRAITQPAAPGASAGALERMPQAPLGFREQPATRAVRPAPARGHDDRGRRAPSY